MIDISGSVEKYLKEDRQWKREHRIAFARAELAKCQNKTSKQFWREVLEANMGD